MTAQIPVSSDFVASIPREHIPAVIAALVARLLVEPELASPAAPSSAPATQDEGPMLTPDEAATVLRRPRRWIYRNAKRLPFVRRISRKTLLCSELGIRRWLATRKAV